MHTVGKGGKWRWTVWRWLHKWLQGMWFSQSPFPRTPIFGKFPWEYPWEIPIRAESKQHYLLYSMLYSPTLKKSQRTSCSHFHDAFFMHSDVLFFFISFSSFILRSVSCLLCRILSHTLLPLYTASLAQSFIITDKSCEWCYELCHCISQSG